MRLECAPGSSNARKQPHPRKADRSCPRDRLFAHDGPTPTRDSPANTEPLDVLRSGQLAAAELDWHPVSKKMSKLGYQEADCAAPVKLVSQQQKSVASFFGPKPTAPATPAQQVKLEPSTPTPPCSSDSKPVGTSTRVDPGRFARGGPCSAVPAEGEGQARCSLACYTAPRYGSAGRGLPWPHTKSNLAC